MNYTTAFHLLRQSLSALYDSGEAGAIAREVLREVTGLSYTEGLVQQDDLSKDRIGRLAGMGERLLTGMPLQYVLGHALFMGRRFGVNEHVLIPRPETEELVQWILEDRSGHAARFSVLDIGTGSGCIPISVKLARPQASVTACDISEGALEVAKENAEVLQAGVDYLHLDFLDPEARSAMPAYGVIVSNPPYIPITEKEALHPNVRDFEPGSALFVPGADPLLFYRAIAAFGHGHLEGGGAIYCELHKDYAAAAKSLFEEEGYSSVVLRRDINGHDRMIKAMRGN